MGNESSKRAPDGRGALNTHKSSKKSTNNNNNSSNSLVDTHKNVKTNDINAPKSHITETQKAKKSESVNVASVGGVSASTKAAQKEINTGNRSNHKDDTNSGGGGKTLEQSPNIPMISKVKAHALTVHVDSPLYNNENSQTFPRASFPQQSVPHSSKEGPESSKEREEYGMSSELNWQRQCSINYNNNNIRQLTTTTTTTIIPSPSSSSIPRYVDANSLLYATPLDPCISEPMEEPHNATLGSVTRYQTIISSNGPMFGEGNDARIHSPSQNELSMSTLHGSNNSFASSSVLQMAKPSTMNLHQTNEQYYNNNSNSSNTNIISSPKSRRPGLPLSTLSLPNGQRAMSPGASSLSAFPPLHINTNINNNNNVCSNSYSNVSARSQVSAPIAIPTYNTTKANEDETACGSPILRSYRHSVSFRDNAPPALSSSFTSSAIITQNTNNNNNNIVGSPRVNGAHLGPSSGSFKNFPFSASNAWMSPSSLNETNYASKSITDVFIGSSPQMNGSFSLRHLPSASFSLSPPSSYVMNAKPLKHTEFLEINGYPLGLENFGNTCYSNSVIQLFYHCTPLRLRLLEISEIYENKKGGIGFEPTTLLCQLCKLIKLMHKSNNCLKDKRRMRIAPTEFMECVREKNAEFHANAQQDAHEFAMFIINDIVETEKIIMSDSKNRMLFSDNKNKKNSFAFWRSSKNKSSKKESSSSTAAMTQINNNSFGSSSINNNNKVKLFDRSASADGKSGNKKSKTTINNNNNEGYEMTPLQSILQGKFGSLTACLECGTVKSRSEVFIDLSLETSQGSSLLNCLQHYGDPECFFGSNKVHCDSCHRSVQAAKTIHVEQLPQYALMIHLKRFRYDYKRQSFTKKADHVALPIEMDVEEYESCDAESEMESNEDFPTTTTTTTKNNNGNEPFDTAQLNSQEGTSEVHKDNEKEEEGKEVQPEIPLYLRRKLRGVARHKARFALTGFVVHIGEGPNEGHYFTCIRYGPQLWRKFDDDVVSELNDREVQQYFGVPLDINGVITTTAYILLYERVAEREKVKKED